MKISMFTPSGSPGTPATLSDDQEPDRVVVTENSEYYIVDSECVAVWNLGDQAWQLTHPALYQRVVGILTGTPGADNDDGLRRIVFTGDVVTSPVIKERSLTEPVPMAG